MALAEHDSKLREYIRKNAISADQGRRLGMRFYGAKSMPRRVVVVNEWGRDCDMVETTVGYIIPATRKAYQAALANVHKNAEGPCSLGIISHEDAMAFIPTMRDRATEAWENGFGANAYSV